MGRKNIIIEITLCFLRNFQHAIKFILHYEDPVFSQFLLYIKMFLIIAM